MGKEVPIAVFRPVTLLFNAKDKQLVAQVAHVQTLFVEHLVDGLLIKLILIVVMSSLKFVMITIFVLLMSVTQLGAEFHAKAVLLLIV